MTLRETLIAMAKAHDQEEAAQKGEPSPWDTSLFGEPDAEFVEDRVVAMQCALEAIRAAGPTEAMVEACVDVMLDEKLAYRVSQIQGFVNHPRDDRHWVRDLTLRPGDQIIWDGGSSHEEMMAALERIKNRIIARACLSAALAAGRDK